MVTPDRLDAAAQERDPGEHNNAVDALFLSDKRRRVTVR
jgi:hypothetical protein